MSIELRPSLLNSEYAGVRRDRDEVASQLERERAANRALRTEAAIADSEAIRVQGFDSIEIHLIWHFVLTVTIYCYRFVNISLSSLGHLALRDTSSRSQVFALKAQPLESQTACRLISLATAQTRIAPIESPRRGRTSWRWRGSARC